MLKVEGRWAGKIEELLAASDARRGIKPKPVRTGLCGVCGDEFIYKSNRRYCGAACRQVVLNAYQRKRQLERRQAAQGLQSLPTS